MRYIWALTRKGGKHSYPSLNDLLATTIVFFLTIECSVDSSSANATNVLNQSVNQTSQHQCMFNLTTVWPKVIALARNQNSLLLTIKPSALSHSLGILQYGMLKLFEAKSKWIGIYFQTQPKIKMILFRCQHFCSTLQLSIFWGFFIVRLFPLTVPRYGKASLLDQPCNQDSDCAQIKGARCDSITAKRCVCTRSCQKNLLLFSLPHFFSLLDHWTSQVSHCNTPEGYLAPSIPC